MRMLATIFKQFKIFNSIVCFILVYVMNMLSPFQFSSNKFFHDNSMLRSIFTLDSYQFVSIRVKFPATFPKRMFFSSRPCRWISCKSPFSGLFRISRMLSIPFSQFFASIYMCQFSQSQTFNRAKNSFSISIVGKFFTASPADCFRFWVGKFFHGGMILNYDPL